MKSPNHPQDVLNRLEGKVNNFTASPPLYLIAHIFPHQHKLRSMFDAANGITMSYNRLMRDAEIEVGEDFHKVTSHNSLLIGL